MAGSFWRRRFFPCLDILLVGVGFWLVAPLPVALIGGPYDAGLFVKLADSVLAGDWLGRFDALTLAKGPFYPLFLAGCAALSVPIQAGIEGVYLAGALVMARVVSRLSGRAWAGSLCLALLVFNPACTDWSTGALMREPLYCALTLLVMALAARVFLCRGGAGWGVALGVAFAAFWLTREEGVLLLPSLFVLAAGYFLRFTLVAASLLRGDSVFMDARTFRTFWPPIVASVTASALVFCVCGINQHQYGVFRSNDFTHGPFPQAYGAWVRIRARSMAAPDADIARHAPARLCGQRRRGANCSPISKAMPRISPSMSHVRKPATCSAVTFPAHPSCGRCATAVARAGYYANARRADGFYKRLAREIDAACDRHALPCLPPRHGFSPPLQTADARPILASLGHVVRDMLVLGRAGPLVMPSTAEGPEALAYQAITHGSAISPPARFIGAPAWQVTGALSSPDPAVGVSVTAPPATSVSSDWRMTPDPAANVSLHRAGGAAEVFSADIRCAPGDCRLELARANASLGRWPMAQLRPRRHPRCAASFALHRRGQAIAGILARRRCGSALDHHAWREKGHGMGQHGRHRRRFGVAGHLRRVTPAASAAARPCSGAPACGDIENGAARAAGRDIDRAAVPLRKSGGAATACCSCSGHASNRKNVFVPARRPQIA